MFLSLKKRCLKHGKFRLNLHLMEKVGDVVGNTAECAICLNPYSDPFSLPCGHSFDKKCLKELKSCPTCTKPFNDKDGSKNYALADVVNTPIPEVNVMEIFLIDMSTSMKYSDGFLPIFGESRIEKAKLLVLEILATRK